MTHVGPPAENLRPSQAPADHVGMSPTLAPFAESICEAVEVVGDARPDDRVPAGHVALVTYAAAPAEISAWLHAGETVRSALDGAPYDRGVLLRLGGARPVWRRAAVVARRRPVATER